MQVLPFLNDRKDLDPSYKMDLDFWDCFVRGQPPSYKQRNTVTEQGTRSLSLEKEKHLSYK